MRSCRLHSYCIALLVITFASRAMSFAQAGTLRVCADPNNMPFSNSNGEGFENKLSQIIAQDLGDNVEYTWWAQRRGYVRNTVKAGNCDVWLGVVTDIERLDTTRPYYRSTYVFVSRTDRHLDIKSIDDPRLRTLTIGVQMVGDDAMNTPPAHALARRGIVTNVRGYMLYGDYSRPDPQRAVIDAVENGGLDVAIVWGPIAGFFAATERHPLTLTPVEPTMDAGIWPMQFDISTGVRHGNSKLKDLIEQVLEHRHQAIISLLQEYNVPILPSEIGESQASNH
jgi:mxaJ protein